MLQININRSDVGLERCSVSTTNSSTGIDTDAGASLAQTSRTPYTDTSIHVGTDTGTKATGSTNTGNKATVSTNTGTKAAGSTNTGTDVGIGIKTGTSAHARQTARTDTGGTSTNVSTGS